MPIRVLFVCTGNTCRSSMAEALMRRLAELRLAATFGRGSAGGGADVEARDDAGSDARGTARGEAGSAGGGEPRGGPADEGRSPESRAAAVEIEVRSAGTGARDGDPASGHAVDVMRERGIDLRSHRARRLTQDLVDWADIILTMTTSHRSYVVRMFNGAEGKTFTLGEFAAGPGGQSRDIDDPWGRPLDTYRRVADEIERALEAALDRVAREKP